MAPTPGQHLSRIFVPRVGGGNVRLPEGPGLVFVFRADCKASAHAADAIHRISDRLVPKGLQVVVVSQDDEGDTAHFAALHGLGAVELGMDVPSLLASETLEIERTPTTIVVDEGKVVAFAEGWSRHEYNALAARAAQLVGAEAPTASSANDGLPDHEPPTGARNAG